MSSNNNPTGIEAAIEMYRRRLRENREMEDKMNETKKEHEALS